MLRLALVAPFLMASAAAPGAGPVLRSLPLVLFCIAAASDFLDGKVARHTGTASGRGQVLDNVADVLFVESALVFFALRGRVSWLVPGAVAAAVVAYARASWRRARSAGAVELDRSAVGHAAGVANYALVGMLAAGLAFPTWLPDWLVNAAGLGTAGLNLWAVLGRLRFS